MGQHINQGHVKLPASYYEKEKLNYSDWRFAWFREAIQNELDAGANRIDFSIVNHPQMDDRIQVVCQGNGAGMSLDKLLNVFLVMGGSEKAEGSIGGFGYAKVILAFAHAAYKIETQGVELNGAGGDYTWEEGHPVKSGVQLTVDMLKQSTQVWQMEDVLRRLIRNSDLKSDIVVTLNGERLTCEQPEYPYSTQTSLGSLRFKDLSHGVSSSVLWVRMRGLAMFPIRLYANSSTAFEGHLDLEGDSKALLTANRDSLNDQHRDVLNQVVDTLANDREKLKLSGDIDLVLNRKVFSFGDLDDELRNEVENHAKACDLTVEQMLDQMARMNEDSSSPFYSLARKVSLVKDKMTSRLEKIPAQWYPTNFKVKYLDEGSSPEQAHKHAGVVSSKMRLKRFGKLAAGWQAIISKLLEAPEYRAALRVVKHADGVFEHDGHLVGTGFVFGSPEGLCNRDKETKQVSIMVNPSIVDDESLSVGDLIDIAHHELTHLEMDYHGEGFTMKESRLRRIARREIGDKDLIQAFETGVVAWRDKHSEKNVTMSRHASEKHFNVAYEG